MAEKQNYKYDCKIYHRLMRFPSFPVSPRQKVIHKTNEKGTVISLCHGATVEDFEKLLCVLYLIYTGKAKITKAQIVTDNQKKDEIIIVSTTLYEIKKISKLHDYNLILESLLKFLNVTLIYDFFNEKTERHEKIFIKPIFKIETDMKNIKIYFFRLFFESCLKKSLYFNLSVFLELPAYAKNLYFYLLSNCDKSKFCTSKLLERTLLKYEISQKKYEIQTLKRALGSLQKKQVIKSFEVDRNKTIIKF